MGVCRLKCRVDFTWFIYAFKHIIKYANLLMEVSCLCMRYVLF